MERYQRQISMQEIGLEGQIKLLDSRVLVIGAGGLGSPVLLYLAAAGIGTLGIVDDDCVDESNLQRQVLHSTGDVGMLKVDSAEAALARLNPGVKSRLFPERFTDENAGRILDGWDFVVDATDNFDSKFLISDSCVRAGVPFSHAGIDQFHGQLMTVLPGRSACYRCVFGELPEPLPGPPVGPLGALPGIIGSMQAVEAMKLILGIGALLTDRILTCDALTMALRTVTVSRRSDCPACGGEGGK